MKRSLGCACVLVLVLSAVSNVGASPLRVRVAGVCRSQQAVARNQVFVKSQAAVFTTVPFAVPVAVPVATVVEPTYFYAYGAYAASAGPAARSTVADIGQGAEIREEAESWEEAGLREKELLEEESKFLDRRAVDVLITRCVSCHSGEGAGGDLVMADEEGRIADKLPRHRLLRAIESGKMPPAKEARPLQSSDIEAIRHWARLPRDLAY